MEINVLTGVVLDACIKIHTAIGPGCFERVYEETLYYELINRDVYVERQVLMDISYEKLVIQDAYRMDLLAEKNLIIEIKSIERLAPVHFKQVMTYLKLSGLKNGLLLNFNVEWMKEGFHRVFNNEGV
ncbi:MAG: GxxExxY protein [Bacteroidetes bacterium]|nr:GxxExxY protein [Bacteroidota bacterium]MBS1631157.1 GxxExxY protein [Bacteroidota bacterium]